MSMLADRIDAVIGVDTHTDTHTAAICDPRGGVLTELTVVTTEDGYTQLLDALLAHAPGPRVAWAIEGTASYGSGLTDMLRELGAEVIEGPGRLHPAPRAGQERHQRRGRDRPRRADPDRARPAPGRRGPRGVTAAHGGPSPG